MTTPYVLSINELEGLVATMNKRAYDATVTTGEGLVPWELASNGTRREILFLGNPVWNTEDDEPGPATVVLRHLQGEVGQLIKLLGLLDV